MNQPPQHDIDSTPIVVLAGDPGWDTDRIEAEIKGLEGEDLMAHPYVSYMAGRTRYDLSAECKWPGGIGCPGDYLNGTETRIEIRRMRLRERCEVRDARDRERRRNPDSAAYTEVWLKAARYGIARITGSDDLEFRPGEPVPESVLEKLCDRFGGLSAITKIGTAVWILSETLTEAEKKR